MTSHCPYCNSPTIRLGKADICTNWFCQMPYIQNHELLASLKKVRGMKLPKGNGHPPKTNRHKGEPRHFVNPEIDIEFRIYHRPKHIRFTLPNRKLLLWGYMTDETIFIRDMERRGFIEQ